MLQWINQNREWLFSGAAIALLTALGPPLGRSIWSQLDSYFKKRFFRDIDKEVKRRVNSIIGYGLRESPVITQDINIDPQKVSLYCITFRQNKSKEFPFEEKWIRDKKIKIKFESGGFSIRKELIKKNLENIFNPYKFYLEIDNLPEEKQKYYARLLEARCIVTGGGEEDIDDERKWRIWFLIPSQAVHSDVQNVVTINHTLINESLVKQETLDHKRLS